VDAGRIRVGSPIVHDRSAATERAARAARHPLLMRDPKTPNRPEGWVPPGPKPRGALGDPSLEPRDDETLSYLTGDFRIFQKKVGHRWSLDDFVTALVATEEAKRRAESVTRCFDLGCGIGSVLMMLAWAFPEARVQGVEAQEVSVALARRSLAFNGLESRVSLALGDLREVPEERSFDLVTGTPPYIPLGSGLVSEKEQRGPCCFETRGGLEDYALAASRLLADDGIFVACGGAWPEDRGARAAAAAGLHLHRRVDVVPREGKPVLFRVYVMRRAPIVDPTLERFVVRDASAAVTAQMHDARRVMGLPPLARS
jgi:tRNA1(Val) A37 N6-methylase TrmN6